jgi:hypothetical protein
MIRDFSISNFRCFESLKIGNCKRINIIVGDNGSGKTALLEAIFLALSGNPEVCLRFKAQRGSDAAMSFVGTPKHIEEALWRDVFFDSDWNRTVLVDLDGDGPEKRSVTISRGATDLLIPLGETARSQSFTSSPVLFSWRDSRGEQHNYSPRMTASGLSIGHVEEDLPDYFLFAANHITGNAENAARFSNLSKEGRSLNFVKLFQKEFPWITDLSIEVSGGSPAIHASVEGSSRKLPVTLVSGGINRTMSIMLAMADRPRSVLLVDEMENGIFHKHKPAIWRSIFDLSRTQESQLFLTTHDEEWLSALVEASNGNVEEVSLWRVERSRDNTRKVVQFEGRDLKAAIEYGTDVR